MMAPTIIHSNILRDLERLADAAERIASASERIAAVFEGPQPDPKPVQPEVPAVQVADD